TVFLVLGAVKESIITLGRSGRRSELNKAVIDDLGITMNLSPIHRKITIGLTAAFLWMWPLQSEAVDQKTVEPLQTVSEQTSGVIPLGDVPMHAAEALNFLNSLKTYELPNPEIETVKIALPEAIAQIEQELARTKTMLDSQLTLFALQARQEHWRQFQLKM